jgi:hypothetical protein
MSPFEITMTYSHPLPTLPLSFCKIHLDVVSLPFIFHKIPHHNYPYTPRQPLIQVHAMLLVTLYSTILTIFRHTYTSCQLIWHFLVPDIFLLPLSSLTTWNYCYSLTVKISSEHTTCKYILCYTKCTHRHTSARARAHTHKHTHTHTQFLY